MFFAACVLLSLVVPLLALVAVPIWTQPEQVHLSYPGTWSFIIIIIIFKLEKQFSWIIVISQMKDWFEYVLYLSFNNLINDGIF